MWAPMPCNLPAWCAPTSSLRHRRGHRLRLLPADEVIDFHASSRMASTLSMWSSTLVGGDVQRRSLSVLKRGGILVSAVSKPDHGEAKRRRIWLVHRGRCDHHGS